VNEKSNTYFKKASDCLRRLKSHTQKKKEKEKEKKLNFSFNSQISLSHIQT